MTLYVNGEKVSRSKIENEADRLRPHYQSVFKDQNPEEQEKQLFQWSKENVIERTVLLQFAKKDSRPIDPEYLKKSFEDWKKENYTEGLTEEEKKEIEHEIELQLRVKRIINEHCKDLPQPTTEQARKYYISNRKEFYTQ